MRLETLTTSPVFGACRNLSPPSEMPTWWTSPGVAEEDEVARAAGRRGRPASPFGGRDLGVGHARDLDAGLRVGPLHRGRSSRSRSAASSRPTCTSVPMYFSASSIAASAFGPGALPPRSPPAAAPRRRRRAARRRGGRAAAAAAGSTGRGGGAGARRCASRPLASSRRSGSGRGTARRGARRRRSSRRTASGRSIDWPRDDALLLDRLGLVEEPLDLQLGLLREAGVRALVPDADAHLEEADGVGVAVVEVLHARTRPARPSPAAASGARASRPRGHPGGELLLGALSPG